jgi:hypothetical protein
VSQERSLAASRLTAKDQHSTLPRTHPRKELIQRSALVQAVEKLWRSLICGEHAVAEEAMRRVLN